MDFYRFSWISMDSYGFERFWEQNVGPPVAACGGLCHLVPPDWIPLTLRFQILEAWIWRPGAWMPGCWKDWNGLEEVTEVTEVTEGLEWMLDGRRGLEGPPTRSSFRSSADWIHHARGGTNASEPVKSIEIHESLYKSI